MGVLSWRNIGFSLINRVCERYRLWVLKKSLLLADRDVAGACYKEEFLHHALLVPTMAAEGSRSLFRLNAVDRTEQSTPRCLRRLKEFIRGHLNTV